MADSIWQIKPDQRITPETLGWLRSMKGSLAVAFKETNARATGPEGQELRGLKLYVKVLEVTPELRRELEARGFVETTD